MLDLDEGHRCRAYRGLYNKLSGPYAIETFARFIRSLPDLNQAAILSPMTSDKPSCGRPGRIFLAFVLLFCAAAARGQFESEKEYMSVSTPRANLRAEPEEKGELLWRLWKFMPVEIVAYRGDWRKIRDLDGDEGWLHKSTLENVPTVMVSAKEAKLRKTPGGAVVWYLERGYAMRVFSIRGDWIEVSDLAGVSGWIHKSVVWGYTGRAALENAR